ncbi:MAG: sigma-70 family RNA polymerase sigma factor [Thermonemataceae bacterium]|nr:sigma-70 family RNA polymerase sigma factor [Thermonemataceae bacterium]
MLFLKRSVKSKKSDEDLLKAFQETQDTLLLGELYERYLSLVFGLCLKYLKNREEAKDMVMHIFEKLSQKLPQQSHINHFKSWLYTFSRNECLMALRKQKTFFTNNFFEENEENGMESNTFLHLDTNSEEQEEKLEALEKALESLSQEQKYCIELFYMQKKSYQEICQITGYEENKVKSYLQNGKRNLKLFLEKNYPNMQVVVWLSLMGYIL